MGIIGPIQGFGKPNDKFPGVCRGEACGLGDSLGDSLGVVLVRVCT